MKTNQLDDRYDARVTLQAVTEKLEEALALSKVREQSELEKRG